jgi:CRP/FNR family transcriptional regulator, anaerobic regulatory protein
MDDRDIEAITRFIQRVAPVPTDEIETFCQRATPKRLAKHEVFVRAGEVCEQLLFIHRGLLRYAFLAEGEEHTKDFAVDTSNRFCTAFTSLVTGRPSEIDIDALEDTEVSCWPVSYLQPLWDGSLPWQTWARRMAQGLYIRKEQREITFLRDSALERYRRFLREFPEVVERVPQYYVASYLGITPEALSRLKRNFQA